MRQAATPTSTRYSQRIRKALNGVVVVSAAVVVVAVGATTATASSADSEADPQVAAYQEALADAGFYRGDVDGLPGRMTRAAVLALEKYVGLERTGEWQPRYIRWLDQGLGETPLVGSEARRVEVDLTRQVGYLVENDEVVGIFGISSGNGETYEHPHGYTGVANTPTGDYRFYSHVEGVREAPLGDLYNPWYFRGGFAIHGSSSVPGYPASHGCVRVENWEADWLSEHLELGMAVHVYRGEEVAPSPLVQVEPDWTASPFQPV